MRIFKSRQLLLILLVVFQSLYCLRILAAKSAFQISNASFIFISGYPQSGTSFMNQIFEVSPIDSTMVSGCIKRYPNNYHPLCARVNAEGQWMKTKLYPKISPLMLPGALLPVTLNPTKLAQITQIKQDWIEVKLPALYYPSHCSIYYSGGEDIGTLQRSSL